MDLYSSFSYLCCWRILVRKLTFSWPLRMLNTFSSNVQREDCLLILSGQLKILFAAGRWSGLNGRFHFIWKLFINLQRIFFKFGPLFLRLSKELRSLWPFFQPFRENSLRQGVSWIMFRSHAAELLRVYCLLDFSNLYQDKLFKFSRTCFKPWQYNLGVDPEHFLAAANLREF